MAHKLDDIVPTQKPWHGVRPQLDGKPHLMFDKVLDRWEMALSQADAYRFDETDVSYRMLIHCSFISEEEGWFDYRFVKYDMGDVTQIVTMVEMNEIVANIRLHEGDEIADLWYQNQDVVEVAHDLHPVFALRDHWEAMMKLNLFMPQVTIRQWNIPRPLDEALESAIREVRERQEREAFDPALEEGTRYERAFGDRSDVG